MMANPDIKTFLMPSSSCASPSCRCPSCPSQPQLTSQTSPSHSPKLGHRRVSYIYELPYSTRKALCDLLDADGSWRHLGGQYMHYDETQLTLVSHALYRGASPTNDLLTRWEASNPKVSQLYRYLAEMRHRRAMLILRQFVDDKVLASLCPDLDATEELGAVGGVCRSRCFDAASFKEPSYTNQSNEKKIVNNYNDLDMDFKEFNLNTGRDYNDNNKNESGTDKKFESTAYDDEMKVPYKELLLATDDFSNERVIGSGGFGMVYKGEWKGTEVAIKKLRGCENMSQAITELRVLYRYRIDNILPLYGVSLDGPEACLLYQYMTNGSLEDRLLCKDNTAPLSWQQRSHIGEGIAKALNYLHTLKGNPLVHGDVKSANVLLDQQFEPKLGDFGLARQVIGSGMYTHCTVSAVHGTSVYLPPEYLRQKILSPAVDVFSYGIVMLEMATGRRAFDGKKLLIDFVKDELDVIEKSETKSYVKLMDQRMLDSSENSKCWFDALLKLGNDCSQKTKKKRPQMIQVLEYFSQCKTRDRIRRLSAEVVDNDTASLPTTNVLKTPLELQLWYDMMRKSTAEQEQRPEEFVEINIPVPKLEKKESQSTTETPETNNTQMLPLITELGNLDKKEGQ